MLILLFMICCVPGIIGTSESTPGNSISCKLCEYMSGWAVESIKKSNSSDELNKVLDSFCERVSAQNHTESLPPLQHCLALARNLSIHFNQIIEDLPESGTELCSRLDFCPSSVQPGPKSSKLKVDDGMKCNLCESLVGQLRDILSNDTSAEGFKEKAKSLCSLPVLDMIFTPKEDCLQFVEFEIAKISVRLSTEDTNDRQVCEELEYCPKLNEVLQQIAEGSISPRTLVQGDPARAAVLQAQRQPYRIHQIKPTDMSCAICQMEIYKLDVKDKNIDIRKKKIKTKFNKYCRQQFDKKTCNEYVDTYLTTVEQDLRNKVAPKKICEEVNLCPTKNLKQNLVATVDKRTSTCKQCITKMDQELMNVITDKTHGDLSNSFASVCNNSWLEYFPPCKYMIYGFSTKALKNIIQEFDSHQICTNLGPCHSSVTEESGAEVSTKTKSDESVEGAFCDQCLVAMKEVEEKLSSNADRFIDQVEDQTDALCEFIPVPGMNYLCEKALVASMEEDRTTTRNTFNSIVSKKLNPIMVCTNNLQYCSATTTTTQKPTTTTHKPTTTTHRTTSTTHRTTTNTFKPTTTTQRTTTTTHRPTTTTKRPTTTTERPTTTTKRPTTTTHMPTTTTHMPTTTTQRPKTTTHRPTTTSKSPTTTTQTSTTTSKRPTTTTQRPTTTTHRPTTTTKRPITTTQRPRTTTQRPSTTTKKPTTTTHKPTSTTQKPTTTPIRTTTTTDRSTTPHLPSTTTNRPSTTTVKTTTYWPFPTFWPKTTTTKKPLTTTHEPTTTNIPETTQTPTSTTLKPTTTSHAPTVTSHKPTTTPEKPTTSKVPATSTTSQAPATSTTSVPSSTSLKTTTNKPASTTTTSTSEPSTPTQAPQTTTTPHIHPTRGPKTYGTAGGAMVSLTVSTVAGGCLVFATAGFTHFMRYKLMRYRALSESSSTA